MRKGLFLLLFFCLVFSNNYARRKKGYDPQDEKNKIKQSQIPCVTLSGTFSERNSKSFIDPSGLIQIDPNENPFLDELLQIRVLWWY